ncbi:MAG: HAD-IA family hydrolase [Chloroflexota bacterium]|nr:HAD-IA family hydrolase [Chloroflexota bacterium]MDE2941622.1 HAD-IA family hydrolase [Chloroflexota bacterium]MDE3267241.1 HAD-IA family hydrolase [Chloroflexota bacterium]
MAATRNPNSAHPPITAVLFDFDDTLVSTYAARLDALQRVFAEAGITDPTAEAFLRDMSGRQLEDALRPLEEREGLPPLRLFQDYRYTYWTKTAGFVNLFPGVRELLEELHRRSLKLAIVTQKGWVFEVEGRTVGASQELAEAGVSHFFSTGVGFESVTNHKPHPEGVLLALEHLNARPEQCILVGDTPADIGAAKAAGCWSVHATWGIPEANYTHLRTDADFVIDTPERLLELPVF